jgi:hypothetical protein
MYRNLLTFEQIKLNVELEQLENSLMDWEVFLMLQMMLVESVVQYLMIIISNTVLIEQEIVMGKFYNKRKKIALNKLEQTGKKKKPVVFLFALDHPFVLLFIIFKTNLRS